MFDHLLIFIIIFPLIIFQSIIGIGILVLGTPILLILNLSLTEILSFLLPFSIMTSGINIFFINMNLKNKSKTIKVKFELNKKLKKYFFFICLPSLFIGLFFLKIFGDYINFKITVGVIVFLSLMAKIVYEKKNFFVPKIVSKLIFFVIGIVHGLTNSGGTLLTMFISSVEKNFKKKSRLNITILYFYLAIIQYLIFIPLFHKSISLNNLIIMFVMVIVASIIGNYLIKIINTNSIKKLINLTAFITALFLILDGIKLI